MTDSNLNNNSLLNNEEELNNDEQTSENTVIGNNEVVETNQEVPVNNFDFSNVGFQNKNIFTKDIFKSDLSFIDFNTEFNLNNSINSFYMDEGDTFEFASDEFNLGRKLFSQLTTEDKTEVNDNEKFIQVSDGLLKYLGFVNFFDKYENINVIAMDMYDGNVANNREDASKYMRAVQEERAQEIVNATINYTGEQAKIATLGWCFGGVVECES